MPQQIAIANDFTIEVSAANGRSPFQIRRNNAIRMLIVLADADNTAGSEVTYTGTGRWQVFDANGTPTGQQYAPDAIPIRAGNFLAIPTDVNTVIEGAITTPGSSVAYVIAKL